MVANHYNTPKCRRGRISGDDGESCQLGEDPSGDRKQKCMMFFWWRIVPRLASTLKKKKRGRNRSKTLHKQLNLCKSTVHCFRKKYLDKVSKRAKAGVLVMWRNLLMLWSVDEKVNWKEYWLPRSNDTSVYMTMGLLSASQLNRQLLKAIYSVMTCCLCG